MILRLASFIGDPFSPKELPLSPNGSSFLHLAVRHRDLGLLKQLLDLGIPANIRDKHGNTPLHFAAKFQFEEAFIPLLNSGADPSAQNVAGETCVQLSVGCCGYAQKVLNSTGLQNGYIVHMDFTHACEMTKTERD